MTVASRSGPALLEGLAASEVFARLVGIGTRLEQSQQRLLRAAGPLLHQLDLPSREDVEALAASLERLEGLAYDATRSSARTAVAELRSQPTVHWHESGRGPVLVLLNGWSLSGLVWPTAWVDRLAQRYRVVRIDNRGTGWSRRAPAPYTIADLADDVLTVLDAVGAERATIARPLDGRDDRPGTGAAGSAGASSGSSSSPAVRPLLGTSRRRPTRRGQSSRRCPPAYPVREHVQAAWVGACAPGFADDHPELIEELVDQIVARPTARPFLLAQLRAVLAWRGAHRLEHLRVPTTIVHGDLDQLMPVGNGMRLAQLIPDARYVELRGAGHLVALEAGDRARRAAGAPVSRLNVVTGSASGIGAAVCNLLEASGEAVLRVDRHQADVAVDLATDAGRVSLREQVGDVAGGRVDAVIACAGIFGTAPDLPIVQVNYFGAVATLVGLRPLLQQSPDPRAVVVSSSTVVNNVNPALVGACLAGDESLAVQLQEYHRQMAYSSSKRAIARFVRRAAPTPDWARAGIPLNTVAPGRVITPMTQAAREQPELARMLQVMEAEIPMPLGGWAQPDDVASADLLARRRVQPAHDRTMRLRRRGGRRPHPRRRHLVNPGVAASRAVEPGPADHGRGARAAAPGSWIDVAAQDASRRRASSDADAGSAV